MFTGQLLPTAIILRPLWSSCLVVAYLYLLFLLVLGGGAYNPDNQIGRRLDDDGIAGIEAGYEIDPLSDLFPDKSDCHEAESLDDALANFDAYAELAHMDDEDWADIADIQAVFPGTTRAVK